MAEILHHSVRNLRKQAERWLSELEREGALEQRPPALYQAYVCDGSAPRELTRAPSVTSLFAAKSGESWRAKSSVIRLLCIAIKAHFFLFRSDVTSEPPTFFFIPDLLSPSKPRFGVCYPFLKTGQSVIVSDCDISLLGAGKLAVGRFPVVLTHHWHSWLDEQHWLNLEKEAQELRRLLSNPATKDIRQCQDAAQFPYGALFDAPEDLRPALRLAGLKWADGVKSLYLPKGFDLAPIQSYFEHLKKERESAGALLHPALD